MKTVLAYITAKDKAEAKRLAEVLLHSKLAACVNVFPQMESLYFWKGKLEKAREAVLVVKTSFKNKKRIISEIKKHHSYDCPCVLFLDVKGGSPGYLKWLAEQLS